MPPKTPLPAGAFRRVALILILGFLLLAPLITLLLLVAKGLPGFALDSLGYIVVWTYSVTWAAALLSGVLLSAVVFLVTRRTSYFHQPYDFGRAFSLGAIAGALAEAFSTWLYRELTRHPFSSFWIAGATIAGCLAGAFLSAIALGTLSSRK